MAFAAECESCANDPYSPTQPDAHHQSATTAVVLGVLGGLCLTALVVAVVVPLIRRSVRRRQSILARGDPGSYYRKARTSDIEQEGGMYLPSRRPPVLHHQKMFPGPESKPLLPLILDPLRPLSAITWSDLHRSPAHSLAAASDNDLLDDEDLDLGTLGSSSEDGSVPTTNRATTSHRTMSRSTRSTGEQAIEDGARSSLPSLQRSPTPPGLPSKRGSQVVAARRASLPITPISPSDSSSNSSPAAGMPPLFAPLPAGASSATTSYNPLSPVSPLTPANVSRSASYARSMTHKPPGMDPVPEDADAGEYAETRSLQLPSPPASPEQAPYDPRWRTSLSSTSGRRPSLTGRQSASTALPFRPRSSTGPSMPLPLTAAFQTSVLRSGSSSSSPSNSPPGTAHGQRYPSITTSAPRERERSRPSSVSVSMSSRTHASPSPSRGPENDMTRPIEAFRRLSTTDIRHRHPYGIPGRDEEPSTRASLRAPDASRVPHVQSATSGQHRSHRHATVYNPPPIGGGPTFTTPPPNPLSPPALGPMPTSMSTSTSTTATGSSAPRLSVQTSHHHRALGMGAAHPSSVTWKSLASGSRSSFSTPHSHLRPSLDVSGSGTPPRSRSNSIRSVRTLPAQLPPLDPVTPLSLSLHESPEDEEGKTDGRQRTHAHHADGGR